MSVMFAVRIALEHFEPISKYPQSISPLIKPLNSELKTAANAGDVGSICEGFALVSLGGVGGGVGDWASASLSFYASLICVLTATTLGCHDTFLSLEAL